MWLFSTVSSFDMCERQISIPPLPRSFSAGLSSITFFFRDLYVIAGYFLLPTCWVKVYKFFSQWIFGGFSLKTHLSIAFLPEKEEVYERKHIVSWNNTLGTNFNARFLKITMPKNGDSKGKGRGKRGTQQPRKKGVLLQRCLLFWSSVFGCLYL